MFLARVLLWLAALPIRFGARFFHWGERVFGEEMSRLEWEEASSDLSSQQIADLCRATLTRYDFQDSGIVKSFLLEDSDGRQ
jgi:hypothetical protein